VHLKDLANRVIYIIAAIFLIGAAWQVLSVLLKTPAFPPPKEAITTFCELFSSKLVPHLKISFFRIGISLVIATVLAVPLGLFLGKNSKADQISAPLLYLTFPIPKVVFLPIFMILLGIGNISKIVLITLVVFYQILVMTRDAARNVHQEYVLSVRSLQATERELYQHVYFPACLPTIFTSLKIGLGGALAVLFLVETYATQEGIGYFIMNSWSSLAYDQMFAGIIAMSLMGFLLYLLFDTCEKVMCSWVNP
jgi:NitT/TauT family transport system permease protein